MKEIAQAGFYRGYHRYIAASDPAQVLLPDCPHPLHSKERHVWLIGHIQGAALARRHRIEADAAFDAVNVEVE